MSEENYEKTISETITWLAEEKMKVEPYQNINSAVHGVMMDVKQFLMAFMEKNK
jgi:hypothetical protein